MLRKWALLVLPILLAVAAFPAYAQDIGEGDEPQIATIIRPPAEGEVAPLNCLVVIQIDVNHTGEDFYYLIVFDDEPVTARWDPDALIFTYYPNRMLSAGMHRIQIYMTQLDVLENVLVAEGTFTVEGARAARPEVSDEGGIFDLGSQPEPVPSPVVSSSGSQTGDFFRLNGRTSVNAAFVTLEGLGASRRQEPDNTTIFDMRGRGQTGDTEFDFRTYMTSDESSYNQPRNRYYANVNLPDYGFGVGDISPRFGPLSINGLRVRGALAWGTVGPVTLHVASGETRRETETTYNDEGRILRRGYGKRTLWVARAGLWEDGPFNIGFNFLGGKEGESDIGTTGDPGDNFVRGLDFAWHFAGDDGILRGAMAEADYDYDDPEEEDIDGAQAREASISYILSGHTFTARWQLIEPGFVNLGLSSLQQDRESWGIEDRLNLSRGMINGRFYFERFTNNVNDTLDFTTITRRYGGQLRYRFTLRGPSLQLNWNMQTRINDVPEGESGQVDEETETIGVGGTHSVDFWGSRTDLRADWRRTDRTGNITSLNDSTQDTITIRLTSRWSEGFQVDLMYGNTKSEYPGRERETDIDRYSVRASYTPGSRAYTIWGRWEKADSEGNQDGYNTERETIELGMRWSLGEDVILEASMVVIGLNDLDNNTNDYDEQTFKIILTQLLN